MDIDLVAVILEQFHGIDGLLNGMSAVDGFQDGVIGMLDSDLESGASESAESSDFVGGDGVGSCF